MRHPPVDEAMQNPAVEENAAHKTRQGGADDLRGMRITDGDHRDGGDDGSEGEEMNRQDELATQHRPGKVSRPLEGRAAGSGTTTSASRGGRARAGPGGETCSCTPFIVGARATIRQ